MRRTVALASLVLLAGCGQPWEVIVQSGPPAALRGAGPLTLSWDTSELELDEDPLDEAFSEMSPAARREVERSLSDMRSTFAGELGGQLPVRVAMASGTPDPSETRIHARLLELERGARGPVGGRTRLVMRIDWIVGGEVVDAIRVERSEPPSVQRPTVPQRLHLLSAEAAQITARFFEAEQERDE
ncbi:MAG TPA: hypothetical protein RMH99_21315 [Sandaracinaceae bacterium LLY-WYZ-13_1]|nr:hypothetical protein [Sandaracinaceae bacterium LLY-WYZ-13_1]